MLSEDPQWEVFLRPTPTIDFNSAIVRAFIRDNRRENDSVTEQVISLYYAVRDRIRYDPYTPGEQPGDYSASRTLEMMRGWCVPKSILYAACCRALGVPARLGYADVRNHLSTENLRRQMGTDIFYWHGYTDVYLNGKWVKATPAFNLSLCTRFNVQPLEFDGTKDSIFHESNTLGQKHMEYVRDHSHFADLPFERIFTAYGKTYPRFFENFGGKKTHDFSEEAAAES
jgi:transglutaminase-like putative cysteine protease